jgi:hypothetical protein
MRQSIIKLGNKKWNSIEDAILDTGLDNNIPLSKLKAELPNRTPDAIVRRACQKGYGAHIKKNGDKSFKYGVHHRSKKNEVSDEVAVDKLTTPSKEVNSAINAVNEIVADKAYNKVNQIVRLQIIKAIDTLDNSGYPITICAVSMLVKMEAYNGDN